MGGETAGGGRGHPSRVPRPEVETSEGPGGKKTVVGPGCSKLGRAGLDRREGHRTQALGYAKGVLSRRGTKNSGDRKWI